MPELLKNAQRALLALQVKMTKTVFAAAALWSLFISYSLARLEDPRNRETGMQLLSALETPFVSGAGLKVDGPFIRSRADGFSSDRVISSP